MNEDFLTEKFCVNKEKKEMKCKAKCHFNKQVKKAKSDQEKTPQVFERFEVNLIVAYIYYSEKKQEDFLEHISHCDNHFIDRYYSEILRPPQAV